MKKQILTWVLLVTMVLSLVGCGTGNSTSGSKTNQTESKQKNQVENAEDKENTENTENTKAVLPVKDRAGNDIQLPDEITSIVSLAPSITETIVALGYADKLVAVDTNSIGIEGISSDLPAYDLMNPDVEKLAELNPSVLLISGISLIEGKDPFKPLSDMGICIISIPTSDSISGIKEDIDFLGQIFQCVDKSDIIIAEMENEIERIAAIGKTITEKKSVYFEIGAAPYMYGFGSDVYLDEMLNIIGAKNVFADQKGWLPIENEMTVNANPDVILTNVNYIENPVDEILGRNGWDQITAVKTGQVYYIDNASSSLPNQNIVKALNEMAITIYPDLYK